MLIIISCHCVVCYLYYTKYRPKQKHLLTFQDNNITLDNKNILQKWRVKMNFKKIILKAVRVIISMT